MNRLSAAASRRAALPVAIAGAVAVAVLAWTASAARPDSTASAGAGTRAVALADAETTGVTGARFRPVRYGEQARHLAERLAAARQQE
ncbi:hypothetical protein [Streptomyces sp. SLBN-31]|uniref:hypothetical protein n=1 Tax=Streptomyces sp. SLBN-31 TaxID=2768444 RepID=UPI001150D0DF|nr:hypothetical protein [Streptomyces sp. SLBN-31]TQJ85472.1 hypothetical protein FBY22_4251 [Streptomyces sp. SLBN-31]